jgi:hypothetical protein
MGGKIVEVPYHKQNRDYTCGPACARMVLEYYGIYQDEVRLSSLAAPRSPVRAYPRLPVQQMTLDSNRLGKRVQP